MSIQTISTTREELLARRREILATLGLTLPAYRNLVAHDRLGPQEWGVRDEMSEIAFLLGEEQ